MLAGVTTAAGIIIGDEILSGKFSDENGPFLIKRLRELGVDLSRLSVVADEMDEISQEVRRCSEAFDLVFTTGGVGPTHDDITLESISRAFNEPLELVPELHRILLARWPDGPPEPALRMARLPRGAELIWEGDTRFPLVKVRNVFIFPGVPYLFRRKFEAACSRWVGQAISTCRIHLHAAEVDIADALSQAQDRWPDVSIGSYPKRNDGVWSVIVTLESRDEKALREAHEYVQDSVPDTTSA